jgi:hypothetical protein
MKLAGFRFAFLFLVIVCATPAQALQVKNEQVILDELADYETCQRRYYAGDWCHDALKRWVKDHPEDAFQAGKMTRKAMQHWVAVPFFANAFEQKKGDCKDKDVQLAVVSALNRPAEQSRALIDQAKKIGFETCFAETKDAIVAAASTDSYLFRNACRDLLAKGLLSGLKKRKCEEMK